MALLPISADIAQQAADTTIGNRSKVKHTKSMTVYLKDSITGEVLADFWLNGRSKATDMLFDNLAEQLNGLELVAGQTVLSIITESVKTTEIKPVVLNLK
ncbi:hypothetical protein FACS1894103_7380 [Campylobacterota bacterium]|nr:hypothetical protein FACS1894103_7380 [Campylobacterota bacterium]